MTTPIIHKSKIGLGILIPLVVILTIVVVILVINSVWTGMVICFVIIAFLAHIYTGTYYRISEGRLFIRCGVLESFDIAIHDIEWIKRTNELTSAPALSVDRLEIGFKGGRVLVSPEDKVKFVNDLKAVNSRIWWSGI